MKNDYKIIEDVEQNSASTHIRTETIKCVFSLIIICSALSFCFWSFFFCPICLIVFVIFCFSCCVCIPQLNIPLWIGVILLIVGGYSITNGNFTIQWHS